MCERKLNDKYEVCCRARLENRLAEKQGRAKNIIQGPFTSLSQRGGIRNFLSFHWEKKFPTFGGHLLSRIPTNVRKCNWQHFEDKSAKITSFGGQIKTCCEHFHSLHCLPFTCFFFT